MAPLSCPKRWQRFTRWSVWPQWLVRRVSFLEALDLEQERYRQFTWRPLVVELLLLDLLSPLESFQV